MSARMLYRGLLKMAKSWHLTIRQPSHSKINQKKKAEMVQRPSRMDIRRLAASYLDGWFWFCPSLWWTPKSVEESSWNICCESFERKLQEAYEDYGVGAFATRGVGRLYHIPGIMDAKVYVKILDNELRESALALFKKEPWYLQHDNDPKHTAHLTLDYLDDHAITVVPWPPQSPDLNPIDNLWSILDRKCNGRKCKNAEELFRDLQNSWRSLDTVSIGEIGGQHASPDRGSNCSRRPSHKILTWWRIGWNVCSDKYLHWKCGHFENVKQWM
jgi:hypothetical protein